MYPPVAAVSVAMAATVVKAMVPVETGAPSAAVATSVVATSTAAMATVADEASATVGRAVAVMAAETVVPPLMEREAIGAAEG